MIRWQAQRIACLCRNWGLGLSRRREKKTKEGGGNQRRCHHMAGNPCLPDTKSGST